MNVQHLSLPSAQTWDAAHPPAYYIRKADYAVLKEGRVELVMGQHEYMTGVATMHICYAGYEGLHYDADSSISAPYMADMLSSGEADITHDWDTCEKYLRDYADRTEGIGNISGLEVDGFIWQEDSNG